MNEARTSLARKLECKMTHRVINPTIPEACHQTSTKEKPHWRDAQGPRRIKKKQRNVLMHLCRNEKMRR